MRQPSTEHLRLGLAVLLIFTPLWGPALGLTGPTYTYESAEIGVEDNRIVVPDRDARSGLWYGIDGFACSLGSSVTRYCALEAATLNGTLTVDHPDVKFGSGHLDADELYLVYYDGRVFERESTWEDGRYVLSTARVSAAAALDHLARPPDQYPTAWAAIEDGSATADHELWSTGAGARVFELDGDYFLVYRTAVDRPLPSSPAAEEALTWFAVVLGSAMLFGRDSDDNWS
ncbi:MULTISPECIES: hypothetical protein [Haloferax]|uniref:Uncharacterized protein n=1 Tax=Haloferax massiliensis TaxID=1476858 RepID=A0A0D6JTD8_9EURY|nr:MULTISPECIES: hypothetical protein [Haloferax]MDS0242180.1 hypothetical protein [Haloferax sp. S2CR25]MDS0445301.1 hypothetical protein [Haloferax sp. S2CR25-2]CQR50835.1 hypothetical protein BN996_02319 [Haloferax massiliensis]